MSNSDKVVDTTVTKNVEDKNKSEDSFVEPILREDIQRFTVFPIKNEYKDLWEFYKLAESLFWTAEEIDLHDDLEDWPKLSSDEQHFVKMVLAFFAATDGIVNENLAEQFLSEVQISEARAFYAFQIAMETIHGETYSLMIDSLIKDPTEQKHLFEAITTVPSISKLSKWAISWINGDCLFSERLVAFACVEGILFCGPFCALYWLKDRKVMPGLTFSNELISRDETLHMDFACCLYSKLEKPLEESRVHQIVREAVEFEEEFITESLPCRLIGMNQDAMIEYIHFVADGLLLKLGYSEMYHAKCPFSFMENIGLNSKTNFFEKRVAEYSRASHQNIGQGESSGTSKIQLLEDF